MPLEYKKQTDKKHKETLVSEITNATWGQKVASVGDTVKFFVQTHFVGNGSDIDIEVEDKKGKKVEKVKGKVFGDQYSGSLVIPDKAKDEITFTAKLSKHGLTLKSGTLTVLNVKVTNMKWGQKEARRGDIVKLNANIDGLPDGAEVMIFLYEYDQNGAHDFITKFPCPVKNKKIEAEWEYEYHEDTDEIPTDVEMKKYGNKYSPPEYFFVVDVHGRRFGDKRESKLLKFQDWIEITILDYDKVPAKNCAYEVLLPDGNKKNGKLDANGYAIIKDVPPGPIQVRCTSEDMILWQNDGEEARE